MKGKTMGVNNSYPAPQSYTPETCVITAKITYGASGAATISGEGFSAFTDTATGKSKLSLDERWAGGIESFTFGVKGTDAVATRLENDSSAATSDPHIHILHYSGDGSGTLADPASGTVVYAAFTMNRRA